MNRLTELTRRSFMYGLGSSLGAVALTDLLAAESTGNGPLVPKPPLQSAKAKACIMLFMEGGPSQVDTFDPETEADGVARYRVETDEGTGNRQTLLRW